jgi:hypothetical protein
MSNVSRPTILRLSVDGYASGARVWAWCKSFAPCLGAATRFNLCLAAPREATFPKPKCSADMKLLALSFSDVHNQDKMLVTPIYPRGPPLWPLALLTVARPLARPTPLPRTFLALNMGAFLLWTCQRSSFLAQLPFHQPQHVRNDKVSDVRSSDVDLIQM